MWRSMPINHIFLNKKKRNKVSLRVYYVHDYIDIMDMRCGNETTTNLMFHMMSTDVASPSFWTSCSLSMSLHSVGR